MYASHSSALRSHVDKHVSKNFFCGPCSWKLSRPKSSRLEHTGISEYRAPSATMTYFFGATGTSWISLVLLSSTALALDLDSTFASKMVLPENVEVPLSGTASPSATISVSIDKATPLTAKATAQGAWTVSLPAMPGTLVAKTISISSSDGSPSIELSDVLVGQVYICSGQSNMELAVQSCLNGTAEAAASASLAKRLRIFQVAISPDFFNVTVPQTNVTPSIPWSLPGPETTPGLSAYCFYHARTVAEAHPDIAIGVVASSWGGTPIQPWMTPEAVAECPASAAAPLRVADYSPSLGLKAVPSQPGTLWNAMLAPLLPLAPTAWLWYQGESNAGAPQQYACLMKSMISQWRASWPGATDKTPFIFVQLAPWPDHDIGAITGLRYSQVLVRDAVANVGMVVAADIGDPSGSNHPIHPPWKQEVGRRSSLVGEALVFKNPSIPKTGPLVVSATWNAFDPSWGSFHFDSNPEGSFCATMPKASGWYCGGVQIKFDRPIELANVQCTAQAFSQGLSRSGCGALGSSGGFEFWNSVDGDPALATMGPTGETITSALCIDCSKCPCMQPAEIWGIVPGTNDTVLQLNTTWISGGEVPRLRYAWKDYPSMSVFAKSDGRPAAPFNLTLRMD